MLHTSQYLFILSTANTFHYCCGSEPVHCFFSQQRNLIQGKAILDLHRTISLERIQCRLCIGVYQVDSSDRDHRGSAAAMQGSCQLLFDLHIFWGKITIFPKNK